MTASTKRKLAWGLVLALCVLHHDFWFWTDRRLVLGCLPVGLAYHIALSLLAAAAWALVVRWDWPERLEDWAAGDGAAGSDRG